MYAAIDPGQAGGVAWIDRNGVVQAEKMPDTDIDFKELLVKIRTDNQDLSVAYELTGGYMPGNSGPSAAKFARHCGMIEGVLIGMAIPTEPVTAVTWQRAIPGLPAKPNTKGITDTAKKRILNQHKNARKNAIKSYVQMRFPHLKVTLKTADALGVLVWLMERRKA